MVVALIAAGILCLRSLVITAAACRRLHIGVRHVLPLFARGWAVTLVVTLGTFIGVELGEFASAYFNQQLIHMGAEANVKLDLVMRIAQHLLPLSGGILFGMGLFVLILWRFPRLLGNQVLGMLARFSPRFAQRIPG